MSWSTSPPTNHAPDELRSIAEKRQLDLATFERVLCMDCQVIVPLGTALTFGLTHWEDCSADDADIRFARRRPDAHD